MFEWNFAKTIKDRQLDYHEAVNERFSFLHELENISHTGQIIEQHFSMHELENFVVSSYPMVPLGMIGFTFLKAGKRR